MGNQKSRLPGAAAGGADGSDHAKVGAAESSSVAFPVVAAAPPVTTPIHHATVPMPMPARRATLDDFIMMKTVGKGSFGKVVMVRKKDDDKIYAMKILKKQMVLARKQYEHTLSER